ncbi:MAG: sigma-70 family RNA polymerase sigma factor [Acidobacteriia bacterium]|nr:sigma-70 family RNA polymerase sigma factor [Terriglobia bacterium]
MPETPGADVTQLLELWRNGDAASFDAASSLLYNELHRIAQSYLRGAPGNATLQPTALINEAYVRLAERSHGPFRDRKHFFALAAKIMRQILVDRARERTAVKRGGESIERVPLDEARDGFTSDPDEFLLLHQALDRLTGYNPSLASVIELRYFAGLTLEETAEVLDISVPTANRRQRMAEAWLSRAISGTATPAEASP